MKKWSLFLVIIILVFYAFTKWQKIELKKSQSYATIPPEIAATPWYELKTPSPLPNKVNTEISPQECTLFIEETIHELLKKSFNCFIFDFWSSYDFEENDLTLTMKIDPKEYRYTLNKTLPIEVDFKVASSNKELLDFNQDFSHTFHASLKNFRLNIENPIISEYTYNRLNLDAENKSEQLKPTFTGYKEFCQHKKDKKQFIVNDIQWTYTGLEGVIAMPEKKGLFKVKHEGGVKQKSSCLAI